MFFSSTFSSGIGLGLAGDGVVAGAGEAVVVAAVLTGGAAGAAVLIAVEVAGAATSITCGLAGVGGGAVRLIDGNGNQVGTFVVNGFSFASSVISVWDANTSAMVSYQFQMINGVEAAWLSPSTDMPYGFYFVYTSTDCSGTPFVPADFPQNFWPGNVLTRAYGNYYKLTANTQTISPKSYLKADGTCTAQPANAQSARIHRTVTQVNTSLPVTLVQPISFVYQ